MSTYLFPTFFKIRALLVIAYLRGAENLGNCSLTRKIPMLSIPRHRKKGVRELRDPHELRQNMPGGTTVVTTME